MVLWYGLELHAGYTSSGTSQEFILRSAAACALYSATEHKLQSDLPMIAAHAGLGDAQERPRLELKPAAASPGPGAT